MDFLSTSGFFVSLIENYLAMKKIYLLLIFALLTVIFSCKSKQTATDDSKTAVNFDEKTFDPYFKGLGTEPFWNIEINDDFVVYKDINGKQEVFTIQNTHQAQDANVRLIRSENNNKQLEITIAQKPCSDGMSDQSFDYKTDVTIISKDKELQLNGCGNYVIPVKMQGKWELISFKGNEVPANKFLKTPYLQFENEENHVSGNASCNGFSGAVYFDNEHIRFSKLGVTRMMCVHDNMETDFLKVLETITHYELKNDELHLFSGTDLQMILKKN